ncbi:MAG: metallopeptidase [Candidatus Diapherotrites archaeon]|nr:metallopeptidase [Candidatus Diapherotrites archaeon]
MEYEHAPDIQVIAEDIIRKLDMKYIIPKKVSCMRSWGAKTDAIARIHEFPRILQEAIGVDPHYVIEFITKRYDKLSREEQEKTVLHELMHIPKTFSGALVPHKCFGKIVVGHKNVNKLYKQYKKIPDQVQETFDGVIQMSD